MKKNRIALILGIVCVVLTFAICVQLKTIDEASKLVSSSFTANGLRDEVLKWRQNYEDIHEELEQAEQKLERVRKLATSNDEVSNEIREKIKLTNRLLGFSELTGKGVIITIEDNKAQNVDGISTGNVTDYIVHDDDLIRLVNDIKNAEVEAISINGQRIVGTTGIVCDGNVVRINGQKISSPFVISIIGFPEGIMGSINIPGGILEILQSVGIVKEVKKANNITIPKYEGIIPSENLSVFTTKK